jgi:hypothetical protein
VATFGLVGCGSKKNETVDTSIATVSNGGMVVRRGEYVYFVNGYTTYETYDKSNLGKSFNVGSLYRAKLNANGELDYTENGSVTSAEKLSSGLAGFESTSLYVFGNYIYYVNPTTEVNKKGELQTSKLDFYRMKIGGGKAERVYQSKEDATKIDFEYYYAEGKVYLMLNENATLKRVEGFGDFSVTNVTSDIKSIVMARDTDDVFTSNSYKNIYYTKTNGDGKIEIYNYNVATNKTEYKSVTDYSSCELMDYKFDHLYYKASRESYPNYTYYYRIDATKNAITNLKEERLTADSSYTGFYLLDKETSGYIAYSDSKTYYLTYNGDNVSEATPIADSKLEIIAVRNNYVYVKDGTDIKRINIYNLKTTMDKTQETVISLENIQTYDYDIDDNNLYVYATQGNNSYVYSVNIGNMIEGETAEAKLLGVYESGDAPEIEE